MAQRYVTGSKGFLTGVAGKTRVGKVIMVKKERLKEKQTP